MPRLLALAAPACLTTLLGACVDRQVTSVNTGQDSVEVGVIPANPNRELDVLFVIDNSLSMVEENRSLVANFGRLLAPLRALEGGLPDLRIAVVTPDLGIAPHAYGTCDDRGGDGGRFHGATCAALGGNPFLSDVLGPDGERVRNYTGTLEDAFSCMADVGADGCGFEQHLAAMAKALTPGVNPELLRPDAALAVVIIADEDDCSAADPSMFGSAATLGDFACHREGVVCDDDPDPAAPGPKTGCRPREGARAANVQQFVDGLRALKSDPRRIVVIGIIGDPDEVQIGRDMAGRPAVLATCPEGGLGASEPGIRLASFINAFAPEQRALATLCTSDLAGAMAQAGTLIRQQFGYICLEREPADRNPELDGVQVECSVVQEVGGIETPIPACASAGTTRPCWSIAPDPATCAETPHHLRLQIDRTEAAPAGAYLTIQCVVE